MSVGNKGNKQWIWLALDVKTREIVAVYVGDRSREGARGLWQSLTAVYRQCAVCYSDFWSVYEEVLPSKRPDRSGQREWLFAATHTRFTAPCGTRVSRLVRRTLSFSKKLDNHIGAIWYLIHHYNASLPV